MNPERQFRHLYAVSKINSRNQRYNKAFKSDSQRLAFFIPLLSSVFTVVWLSVVVALLTP
ncbi:hypothetical protein DZF87_24475 [Vibrio parahaemolyticus]|nr:hypothetical protein [Vibrio parahaemolyticus]TOL18678.1 hypothetical protein CGI02_24355 [Vibrio parahaemolyticus]